MTQPGPTLDPAARRRLRQWRWLVMASIGSSAVALAVGVGALLVPGASSAARVLPFELAMEGMLAAGLLTAFGRCPACRQTFGITSGRLAPERCAGCGVALD